MHHHDYWEWGIHTIPLSRAMHPMVQYSKLSQSDYDNEETQYQWDFEFPVDNGYGVGISFGKGSDLLAIDIDTTSSQKLASIRKCLPSTPCEKFGSKGTTMFFRKDHLWRHRRKILLDEIEIFCSDNTWVAVPPTINQKNGKQYVWTKAPLLDCYDYLPQINESDLETVMWVYKRKKVDSFFSEAGRNNKLISRAGSLAKNDTLSMYEKIVSLYEFDKSVFGSDSWFCDDREHKGRSRNLSPLDRAALMMHQIQKRENSR